VIIAPLKAFRMKSLHLMSDEEYALENFTFDTFKEFTAWHDILQYLVIQDFALEMIKPGVFSHFKRLEKLDLCGMNISKIRPGAFKGRTYLTDLDLGENKFYEIDMGTFDDSLRMLKILSLSDNLLVQLEPGVFKELRELRALQLLQNPFSAGELHEDTFSGLEKLEKLYLARTPFTKVILVDLIFYLI
jgi:hypothetical protein